MSGLISPIICLYKQGKYDHVMKSFFVEQEGMRRSHLTPGQDHAGPPSTCHSVSTSPASTELTSLTIPQLMAGAHGVAETLPVMPHPGLERHLSP